MKHPFQARMTILAVLVFLMASLGIAVAAPSSSAGAPDGRDAA